LREDRFEIANLVIALRSEIKQGNYFSTASEAVEPGYQLFTSEASPDVVLEHHWQDPPGLKGWEKVFDNQGVWQLYQRGNEHAYALFSPIYGPAPYKLAIFQPDYSSGEIYTSRSYFDRLPFPLRYPLAELLMINLLGQGRGVLLHACAVRDDESGLLFSGVSGAGKSTTARLWESQPSATLLSDDRIIVREKDSVFWIYGTPWHGDARVASPLAVPLERIFILRHAPQNQALRLKPFDLAARLFVRCFPPFWDQTGVEFSLQLLDRLCQSVPGYELGFVPDESVIDYVRSIKAT
jgi:hypothetical protein